MSSIEPIHVSFKNQPMKNLVFATPHRFWAVLLGCCFFIREVNYLVQKLSPRETLEHLLHRKIFSRSMNSNRKSPVSGDLISKKPNGKDKCIKGFYKQTTKKGISKSKPSSRKAPPKHAATQVSDATQREMLISHDSLDVNAGRRRLACVADQRRREAIHGKGARRRRIRHTTILSTIGEARARAWQVATPPVAIGQGMYISVFGAREPETGRILALKKARGSKRYMQDVNACVLN
ncbi:unnamed protein product [Brassica oleracea var. botrytis]|uniref:(rape) hypothetical protein n=1 Tax=Brassica napus TaxID=3708 RepID=A0A816LLA6_BRANA|nr:unnamed protein product [Brassica napus]